MCRIVLGIGNFSPEDINYFIFSAEYSLLKQAEVENQPDGWGMIFYNGGISFSIKSLNPFWEDIGKIKFDFSATAFLFFVRKASNPLNLPKEKLMTIEATQPFSYKNLSFAHNGEIRIPDKISEKFEEKYGKKLNLKSFNDSEVYFEIFKFMMEEVGDMEKNTGTMEKNKGDKNGEEKWRNLEALKKAKEFMDEVGKIYGVRAYGTLNTFITDGENAWILNLWEKSAPAKLMERNYYEIVWKIDEKNGIRFLAASEPLDKSSWNSLQNGNFLFFSKKGKKIEIL